MVDVIFKLTGIQCALEWPNDIILDYKKVGGILIETISGSEKKQPRCVIVGVGLNLNQTEFPKDLVLVAVSLRQKVGRAFDKGVFVGELGEKLVGVFGKRLL